VSAPIFNHLCAEKTLRISRTYVATSVVLISDLLAMDHVFYRLAQRNAKQQTLDYN